MRFLAAFIVMSTAALVSSTVATPSAPTKLERRAALEAAVVSELNRVRAEKRLGPLRTAPSLRTAARSHSQAMLAHGFFGHDSADGTDFGERIRRHYTNRGWASWSVGEALLASSDSSLDPKAVVAAWLDSPPHRAIILSPTWREAGIGVLYAPTAPREFRGSETIVVTADFGVREGRASSL
jgi:uncharacterized protein YkwD